MTTTVERASCPYVGLQPFHESDRQFFFGRERDQRIIISNLLAAPLTILYGSSGVGKSSVLMAGVVPQLHHSRPKNPSVLFRNWVGDNFRLALARTCIETVWSRDVGQPRPSEDLPFDEVLRACAEAAHETILVLFDQFEEYFLYHPESSRPDSFEAELARAINREDVDAGFLISLREDGLSELDRFQTRIPNLLSNRLRLRHLDQPGARSAIRSPVLDVWNQKYAGDKPPVMIEDDLVDVLIDQVRMGRVRVGRLGGSGHIQNEEDSIEAPFLQLVMTRLWEEEMAEGSRVLRLATLRRLKGAKEIVRSHLDKVMAALDPVSRAVCATFFDRLVTPSGGKIACSAEDLAGWAGDMAPQVPTVLESLSHNRILRTTAGSQDKPDATHYEIYHDVLAPAILDWRHQYVEDKERQEALVQARQQAAKRALRRWVAALATMTAIAVGGWGYAYWETLRAEANQKAAQAIATSPHDAQSGLRLAIDAAETTLKYGLSPTRSAEDAIRDAIQASRLEWTLKTDDWVWDVTFSPDGRRLATASRDQIARIWNVANKERPLLPELTFPHADKVRNVAFLPDDDRLVTSAGEQAHVWALDHEEALIKSFSHGGRIFSAFAVSRDGLLLATADRNQRVVKIWNLKTLGAEPVAVIDVANAWVMGLAFSTDGCCLATAYVERGLHESTNVAIWSIETKEKLASVPLYVASDTIEFTSDGTSLVIGDRDGRAHVSRPAAEDLSRLLAENGTFTANARDKVAGPEGGPSSEAEQNRLSIAISPGAIEPATPAEIPWTRQILAGHLARIRDVAVSPDGSRIATASADFTAKIWDAETGEMLRNLAGHKSFVEAVAFSPDGEFLATGSRDKTVRLWNIGGHSAGVYDIAFSPDGRTLFTASGDHTAKVWDVSGETPRLKQTLRGHAKTVYRMAVHPSANLIATASFDQTIKLWDTESGSLVDMFRNHRDELRDLAFSPEGRFLISTGADGAANLYTLEESQGLAQPLKIMHNAERKNKVQASAVAFHPKEPRWVSGGWDGALRLWDFEGNALGEILHPRANEEYPPRFVRVAFTKNGAEVAALAGRSVLFWRVSDFAKDATRPARELNIEWVRFCSSFTFSPDETQIAVGCNDGAVRFYNPQSLSLEKTITVHTRSVEGVAFSPDGTRLATASVDQSFHISPLPFDDLYGVAKRLHDATVD